MAEPEEIQRSSITTIRLFLKIYGEKIFIGEFEINKTDSPIKADINVIKNDSGKYEAFEKYTVKQGDKLWEIAARYHMDYKKLASLNKLEDPGQIKAGDTLWIPLQHNKQEIIAWWNQNVLSADTVQNALTLKACLDVIKGIYRDKLFELLPLYKKVYEPDEAYPESQNDLNYILQEMAKHFTPPPAEVSKTPPPNAETTSPKYTEDDINAWWNENVWEDDKVKNASTLKLQQEEIRKIYRDKYPYLLWLYEQVYKKQSLARTKLENDLAYNLNPTPKEAGTTTSSEGNKVGRIDPVQAPPSDYNNGQKAQYYLSKLGFNIGTDAKGNPIIDGNLGVMSASSIILFQQKMGLKITGTVDNATLGVLADCAQKGISYDDIIKKEDKELASMPQGENGYLNTTSFTTIPAINGTYASLPEKAAVAWANLVQAAAQDPNNNVSVFYLAGPVSGYRSYQAQVDLKVYWTNQGKPGNAATPGRSDHGWGRAADLNVSDPQTGVAQSYELKWLEKNAKRFGFEPLLNDGMTRSLGVNYYIETWHWTYTG